MMTSWSKLRHFFYLLMTRVVTEDWVSKWTGCQRLPVPFQGASESGRRAQPFTWSSCRRFFESPTGTSRERLGTRLGRYLSENTSKFYSSGASCGLCLPSLYLYSVHFIYIRFDASLPLPDAEEQFHPSDHISNLLDSVDTVPGPSQATLRLNIILSSWRRVLVQHFPTDDAHSARLCS